MNRFFTLLLAVSCLTAVGQYEVGDVGPAGGWIFYVDSLDEFDWDFLEVADKAIAATREMNGDSNVSIDGQGLPAELGTGRSNSQKLVANNSAIPQFSAIIQALGCELGGYSDWFIPSFEEMHLVYENVLDLIDEDGDLGNLTADWVWTSSSVWSDVGLIDLMHLTSGNPLGVSANGTNHDFNIRVIPIRSGNIPSEEFCGFGTIWDPTSQSCVVDESACGWQPDGNGDNLIGVNDLLDLLGVYGDTDYDQDGIWDSADDCVGEYDECGVCNGSGPSIPIIESIEILYDSLYAEQIDEWWVFEVGVDTTFTLVCEVIVGCTDDTAANFNPTANIDDGSCWQGCGQPFIYHNDNYETALIGGQCWFAENLRTFQYSNGDPIVNGQNIDWPTWQFGSTTTPYTDSLSFIEEYGRWYNWYAVSDERSLCPMGWHVPSDMDWIQLETFLGMPLEEANDTGWRGTNEGSMMKDQPPFWNGSNESGLGIRPAGQASPSTGMPEVVGSYGLHWTSTSVADSEGDIQAITRNFPNQWNYTGKFTYSLTFGASVRCIKDWQ